ncbi:hypothetical protein F5Y12DRAFT_724984 [Xylaria sp. FL1777]|nr:hypothetical protein F5Y12DRAFT_724984 [Xylaria sp. FL1777]
MSISTTELDCLYNIILVIYLSIFVFTRANQIRYFATVMADTLTPQTPPKKLFKPSSKTKTPTRSKLSPQSTQQQQTGSPQKTPKDVLRSAAENQPTLDSVAKSTNLAPLADISATTDKLSEHAGSDTTGETPIGLIDNSILTPTDTASRSTDARPPLSRDGSQNVKRSSSFKDKIAQARESAKEPTGGLAKSITGKYTEAAEAAEVAETAASSLPSEAEDFTHDPSSSTDMAKYFKDQGNPEMSSFVTSLIGDQSLGSSENTPRASKSPTNETQSPNQKADQENKKPDALEDVPTGDKVVVEPANLSKTADGTFRDTGGSEPTAQPINKMGEPNISSISQAAQPAISSVTSDPKRPAASPQPDDQDMDEHIIDNMGRPTHVERRIEIPFKRPERKVNGSQQPEGQGIKTDSHDLGDFEDLPSVENLPSTDDLPDIPEDESPDPPEEFLDPSVHSTTSTSITPIPKIPKIAHIDSSPPVNLLRLTQGLTGHTIDDVGNIVDESGEVLGHATGDLPAMVGKKVSDNGEIYGDGGEIVGYVCDNFVDPPSPTEIPGDIIGGLRVDHKGNILDSDGKIIGKFHQPPQKKSSSPNSSAKAGSREKPKEEQKPKVNAQTGGSPSDLFLDVKSTTDGIQLTIRIPTTFSRPPPES